MIRKSLLVAGFAVLVAIPLMVDGFQVALVTRGLVWATLALSVWFLLRILSLPSFGHAAFFGVAAYAAGLSVTRWGIDNVFVALALSIALTCLVALPIVSAASRSCWSRWRSPRCCTRSRCAGVRWAAPTGWWG